MYFCRSFLLELCLIFLQELRRTGPNVRVFLHVAHMVKHCSTIHVNRVVMGSNSIEALEFLGLISNCYLHLRKRPHKSMPYIILFMHLVSHKIALFIIYMNVFVISYSVMMAVGSCQCTEVELMQS